MVLLGPCPPLLPVPVPLPPPLPAPGAPVAGASEVAGAIAVDGAVVVGISLVGEVSVELVLESVLVPLLLHPLSRPTVATAPAIPRSVVRPACSKKVMAALL